VTSARLHWSLFAVAVTVSTVVVAAAFNPVPHTGGDNAGYISLAHGLLTTGSYTDVFDPEGLPHTKYPPVFPGILAVLIGFGARSWVALKLTAVVSTITAVGLTYLLAARSLGAVAGLAVALVFALSSAVVYYSHWILSDPVFMALTLAGLLALRRADEDGARGVWLVVGVAAAGMAFFTRSAGLPLVLALLGWLAFRRRWGALGTASALVGLPMLLWWLRGRAPGVAQYGAEFWMVDPYQPALGSVGVLGLIPRLAANAGAYVLNHGPAGVFGADGPFLAPLGIVLGLAALAGWGLLVRERLGPVEIFLPLYTGLILLWPEVWSGDRFALPLYPLVFLYGAVALREARGRLPEFAGNAVAAIVFLSLFLPAATNWVDGVRTASTCASISEERGSWACYGPQVGYFVSAAAWTARGLPDGSAVLSRKPRHFYLLSGHPSRAFPFNEDPVAHLALADSLGARYVLLDRWDGLAGRYVGAAVRGNPGAFCYVGGFGPAEEGGSQLLGILPLEARRAQGPGDGGGIQLAPCPSGYSLSTAVNAGYTPSGRIPLLETLDS